jgi:hypothetical protein
MLTIALLVAGWALPAAGAGGASSAPRAVAGSTATSLPEGLIAYGDSLGIGVLDPVTGQHRLVLALPTHCGQFAPISVDGLAWAAGGAHPELYFWLTDSSGPNKGSCGLPPAPSLMYQRTLLVEEDIVTGSLRLVAASPGEAPCTPMGLVALVGNLSFTDGGCDVPSVLSLNLPLTPRSQPRRAKVVPAHNLCATCVGQSLLGPGRTGTVLILDQSALMLAHQPSPYLQWYDPARGTTGLFSPSPPVQLTHLYAAATSPSGDDVALAMSEGASGVLATRTGSWSPVELGPCHAHCVGAEDVSWSPDGRQLAFAFNNDLVVTSLGSRSPRIWLAGEHVASLSWSGPVPTAALPGTGRVPSLASDLKTLAATLAIAGGGERSWVFPSA